MPPVPRATSCGRALLNAAPGRRTASQNHSGVPRFMCNRRTPLRDRLQFSRPNAADLWAA